MYIYCAKLAKCFRKRQPYGVSNKLLSFQLDMICIFSTVVKILTVKSYKTTNISL